MFFFFTRIARKVGGILELPYCSTQPFSTSSLLSQFLNFRSYWLVISHHVPYHEQIVKYPASCIRLLPTSQRPSFQKLKKLSNPSLLKNAFLKIPGASPGRLSQQHTTSPRCGGFGFVGNTGSQDQWIHFQGGPAGWPSASLQVRGKGRSFLGSFWALKWTQILREWWTKIHWKIQNGAIWKTLATKKDREEGFKKARLRDNNDADADIFPPTLTPTSTTFAFTSPTWYTCLFQLFLVVFFLFWDGEG